MDTGKPAPSLTLVREYNASPEKVWAAWTSTEALKRWMAPSDNFTVPLAEVDLRVGGRYRILMRAPDGEDHDVSGVYRTIQTNRTLEFTWAWKSTPERQSLVRIELQPTATGTRFTMTHSQFFDQEAADHHAKGWDGCIARLGQFLALH